MAMNESEQGGGPAGEGPEAGVPAPGAAEGRGEATERADASPEAGATPGEGAAEEGGRLRSAWQRRLMYGANGAAMAAATAVIVVIVNWAAVTRAGRWGGWVRQDLTATRKYSLSDQTRKLLRGLDEPVAITTVFAEGVGLGEAARRRMRYFRDLLDEYERLGRGRIDVEHIDPTVEVRAFDRLAERVRSMYGEELGAARRAIAAGREAAEDARRRLERIAAYQRQGLGAVTGADPGLGRWVREVGLPIAERAYEDLGFEEVMEDVEALESSAWPEYGSVRRALLTRLERLDERGYQRYLDKVGEDGEGGGAEEPAAIEEFKAGLRGLVGGAREDVRSAIDQLEAAEAEGYAQARRSLQQSDTVLIATGGELNVIELGEVYTEAIVGEGDEPASEERFRGEEAVTGAIIGLTLAPKPMVVFVNPLPTPALGRSGLMRHVAERLEGMSFEVREWRTGSTETPYGREAPTPRPEPREGQPVVWIYLSPPLDQRMMFAEGLGPAREDFAATLMEGGDVLALVPYWPLGAMGMGRGPSGAPYVEPLASIGLRVDADARLHSEVARGDGETMAIPQVELFRWPKDHPIGRSVQGQPGVLVSAVPMTVDPEAAEGVDGGGAGEGGTAFWPLIRTPAETWAESGMADNPSRDEDEAAGPLTVGYAIERGDQRVVAIGDALFAIDRITRAGPRDPFTGRLLQARYPANAELFLNSVYWLAGVEQLIAGSARAQEVRRFEPIERGDVVTVMWIALAGLPAACLVVGGGVWLVRRK